ncbi:hypothetical protein [Deinococcus altitudinis]|uniref:hypothetical protein n=1 Tax=Deinococcus altitudinis TaxID=468914 RepID=UPI003891CEBB
MLYRDVLNTDLLDLNILPAPELLQRICVRPPYFALEQLRYQAGVLSAVATSASSDGPEYGPMPGAELSRHAAIAGLSVAAMAQSDDHRRYYLAQEARYSGTLNRAPLGTPVHLTAELISLDKRQARSRIVATADGAPLAEVEVSYTILTDSAFSRLFRNRYQPHFSAAALTEILPLPLGQVRQEGALLVREVDQVPAGSCAGHFDGYPAMPVAILMGQLAELAGQALGQPFHISEATVRASDFCWAGEAARFEVTAGLTTPHSTGFTCAAFADERAIGQMELTLVPLR